MHKNVVSSYQLLNCIFSRLNSFIVILSYSYFRVRKVYLWNCLLNVIPICLLIILYSTMLTSTGRSHVLYV
jgi:hypothetical protein